MVIVALLLALVLTSASSLAAASEASESILPLWQVQNSGGHYSETDSAIRIWTEGGDPFPLTALYRPVSPVGDFNFSCEVNSAILESCSLKVECSLPIGKQEGFALEFGHYGEGLFILSRQTGLGNWSWNSFGVGKENVWYLMQLRVFANPFHVVAEVFDENGASLGSASAFNIDNFSFQDIKYLGLQVWGYSPSEYSFRNIKITFDKPSYISISTESSSINAGSAVNVFGTLTDSNNDPIQNETIVLSYTFEGANSWIPLSSDQTDAQGKYSIQWINAVSGTFTLKVEWRGDAIHMGASNTTTLSFMPLQKPATFIFESNSTISALTFNNETSTLTFNVTGPSGTAGFVRAVIAKESLTSGENLIAQIDGKDLNYSVTSTDDSWIYYFSYSHSTHKISLHISENDVAEQPAGNLLILVAIIAVLGVVMVVLAYSFSPVGTKEKASRSIVN
jgi:hypothetical protein